MKILYGVQGTGNGHISRARAMSRALETHPDVEVTWLLSGRPKTALFGVADRYLWRKGLTFASQDGKVSYMKTLLSNDFARFIKDVRSLDLTQFDEVLIDFEPVAAWAAKLRGAASVGISHQYAFHFPIPKRGSNALTRSLMWHFAPVEHAIGVHWHHFNYPILPPILDLDENSHNADAEPGKIVVYMPFEDQDYVIRTLRNIHSHNFFIYGPGLDNHDTCNIHTRALARDAFKRDLASAEGAICNSGFELISECLALGVKVLTKPLAQQMEQLSNARALEELDYAKVMYRLNEQQVRAWLDKGESVTVDFPAVHAVLARWLLSGKRESREELAAALWNDVAVTRGVDCSVELPGR